MPLPLNTPAPDFTLPDASGIPITLSQFRGRPVVLYFYPKDFTPGCTAEACAFRDDYEEFTTAGATILGVSADTADAHARFTRRHALPFLLLSDTDNAVRGVYRVPRTLGLVPGRATYIIDAKGLIQHVFSSQLRPKAHVTEALRVIHELATAAPPPR